MIAYNSSWRESQHISREAKRWSQSNIISEQQYQAIRSGYATQLYSPNFFIRVALFLFMCVCILSVFGLIITGGVFGTATGITFIGIMGIIMGSACVAVLEYLIRKKHLYRAGIDDALLYGGALFIISGIIFALFDQRPPPFKVIPWLIALPFLVTSAVRYADVLMTAASYLCVIGILCIPLFEAGTAVTSAVPFLVIIISLLIYGCTKKWEGEDRFRPWEECFTVIEALSLSTLYLGGNYFIVRQITENILLMPPQEGKDIPFAIIFYALTVIVPVAYLAGGLRRKNHTMLRVGLLAAGFSVFTFKYYFSLGHPEIILTFGGGVLVVGAMMGVRYLKLPKYGFTQENLIKSRMEGFDIEGLVLSQTVGTAPAVEKKFTGGGGEFGGGGSQGTW